MSIQSKARREAKKRKATKERNVARANAPAIEPHAELRNPQGDLLAGIVRQAGVWVLGMDGRIAGSSDSAAEVLAKWIHPELFADLDPAATLAEINKRFLAVPYTGDFWADLKA